MLTEAFAANTSGWRFSGMGRLPAEEIARVAVAAGWAGLASVPPCVGDEALAVAALVGESVALAVAAGWRVVVRSAAPSVAVAFMAAGRAAVAVAEALQPARPIPIATHTPINK